MLPASGSFGSFKGFALFLLQTFGGAGCIGAYLGHLQACGSLCLYRSCFATLCQISALQCCIRICFSLVEHFRGSGTATANVPPTAWGFMN